MLVFASGRLGGRPASKRTVVSAPDGDDDHAFVFAALSGRHIRVWKSWCWRLAACDAFDMRAQSFMMEMTARN